MLSVSNLALQLGTFALEKIDLDVATGECVALMGRTGSGKTSLLEAICGLRKIDTGSIEVAGIDVTTAAPGARGIGLVPQDTVLFSSMTVRDHFELGPKLQKWSRDAIRQRSDELGEQLGVSHLLDRKPAGLSGGEGKRVSIGRAIATKPKLLCLDEAFVGLDDETHEEILDLIRELQEPGDVSILLITHRMGEASALASRMVRLRDGALTDEALPPLP